MTARTLADVLRELAAVQHAKKQLLSEAFLMTIDKVGAYIRVDDRWFRRRRMGLVGCKAPVVLDANEVVMPDDETIDRVMRRLSDDS